ncbi:hypothetical protein [Agromyces sp. SYSU T00194]|uniref:hypothetical protein n=1 Tax=Agromyces chitinivorans TaxID=3158560 RepID=UPI00339937C5
MRESIEEWLPLVSHLFGVGYHDAMRLPLRVWSIYINQAADMKRRAEETRG